MEGKQNKARYLMSKNNNPEPVHTPVMKRRSRSPAGSELSLYLYRRRDTKGFFFFFYNPSKMRLRDTVSHFICHGLVPLAACLGLLVIAGSVKTRFYAAEGRMRVVKK